MSITDAQLRIKETERKTTRLLDEWIDHMEARTDLDDDTADAIGTAIGRNLSLRDAILCSTVSDATRDDLATIALRPDTPAGHAIVDRILTDAFGHIGHGGRPGQPVRDRATWAGAQLRRIALIKLADDPHAGATAIAVWAYAEWLGLGHSREAIGLALRASAYDQELVLAQCILAGLTDTIR